MPALSIPPSSSSPSPPLLLLSLLLLLFLLPHPVLPTGVLADDKAVIAGELQSPDLTGQIFKESSSSMNPRVELHEVEAGANPISNSLTVSWPANP